ncbi:hypothetical protein OSB04_031237 [Centaurea solstitialis]|uniref:PHD finger protein ALFIN-LIKE n=1 Tax=Centaurea solstitialis TaxID=347529 RepID=A0AA38W5S9_9ASTR|nr:hypothetical protein OSB04_031237 [Centaurea solstitialis]
MDGSQPYNPRTVEEMLKSFISSATLEMRKPNRKMVVDYFPCFCQRKYVSLQMLSVLIITMLGSVENEKENLCLYGFPNEQWEVNLPAEEVPPELPEPALGINFARDGMPEKDWLALVAVHGDAWLLAVAFYFGARFGFDKADRKRLFNMINDLPTIFEVVSGAAKKQVKEKSSVSNHSSSKSKSNSKAKGPESQPKFPKAATVAAKEDDADEDDDEEGLDEEDEEEHGDTLCGSCGENYASDEFWICCDICEKWFHGSCVKITPARAEHIKQYKCPACTNKRARP